MGDIYSIYSVQMKSQVSDEAPVKQKFLNFL